MSALVRLYPAAWRARYGAEFETLLRNARRPARDLIDILLGALDARISRRRCWRRPGRDAVELTGLGRVGDPRRAPVVRRHRGRGRHRSYGDYTLPVLRRARPDAPQPARAVHAPVREADTLVRRRPPGCAVRRAPAVGPVALRPVRALLRRLRVRAPSRSPPRGPASPPPLAGDSSPSSCRGPLSASSLVGRGLMPGAMARLLLCRACCRSASPGCLRARASLPERNRTSMTTAGGLHDRSTRRNRPLRRAFAVHPRLARRGPEARLRDHDRRRGSLRRHLGPGTLYAALARLERRGSSRRSSPRTAAGPTGSPASARRR